MASDADRALTQHSLAWSEKRTFNRHMWLVSSWPLLMPGLPSCQAPRTFLPLQGPARFSPRRDLQLEKYITYYDIHQYIMEAQEGSPPQVTRSLFFKAPGHQVTFFHEKIKTTQVTGRFFKLSRSRGRPQNGPRSQVAKNPSWASLCIVFIFNNTEST